MNNNREIGVQMIVTGMKLIADEIKTDPVTDAPKKPGRKPGRKPKAEAVPEAPKMIEVVGGKMAEKPTETTPAVPDAPAKRKPGRPKKAEVAK